MRDGYIRLRHRILAGAICGSLGMLMAQPAFADSELEVLKRELAEQKQRISDQQKMIERLMSAQESQKQINAKVEAQVASTASKPAAAPGDSLEVYGVGDVNVASMNSGFGHKTSIGSGGMSSSRLGVKGERAISSDIKVVGLAEAGVLLDTGSTSNTQVTPGINNSYASSGGQNGTGPQLFSRQVFLGLKSETAGSVTLGRQYSGSYLAAAAIANAMGAGFYGTSAILLPLVGMPTRVNNSLIYTSPKMGGFTAMALVTTGSENNVVNDAVVGTTKTNDRAGQGSDLALFYKNGSLEAALTAWSVTNASYAAVGENALAKKTGAQLAANYDFGIIRVHGTYVQGKTSGGNYENVTKAYSKSSGSSLSASIPFGPNRFYVSYSQFDDKSVLNKDAKLVGLAYTYDLLKNTKLYATWGKMINNNSATYSLADGGNLVGNVTIPGFKPVGYMFGVNTTF